MTMPTTNEITYHKLFEALARAKGLSVERVIAILLHDAQRNWLVLEGTNREWLDLLESGDELWTARDILGCNDEAEIEAQMGWTYDELKDALVDEHPLEDIFMLIDF